jgi:2-polyprenyl-3-methyl-5-hydroxy-6-metoxy-1,4-benzoquinol methylase
MTGGMESNWDERYRDGQTPWDTGRPCRELQRVLAEYGIGGGRVLELGCGTGTNCVYLASLGFDVTGVDVSPTAIATADARATEAGASCRFVTADVFHLPDLGEPFPFIFDRGCYHVVRQVDESAVLEVFRQRLAPGGWLLVLTGNANETLEMGPPPVSEEELRGAFAADYEIVHLRSFRFDASPNFDERPLAWSLLMRRPA